MTRSCVRDVLPGVVRHFCEDPAERVGSNGEIRCLVCKTEIYDVAVLRRLLDETTFDSWLTVREDTKITSAVAEALRKAEEDSAPGSRADLEIQWAVNTLNSLGLRYVRTR